jgi:outer membrane protein assembly factor BamB
MSKVNMGARWAFGLVVSAALTWLGGCGGQKAGVADVPAANGTAGETPAIPQSMGQIPIPSPTQVLADQSGAKSASSIKTRDASDFVPEFSQRVNPIVPEAIFSPVWEDNHSSFETIAYAIYEFELPGWSGQLTLHTDWPNAPDYVKLWLGLSNWEHDRWDWYDGAPSGDPVLAAEGMERYKDLHSRKTYVAVILLGQASGLLSKLWISGTNLRGDWWMQGHDPQHTSRSRFVGPYSPAVKWQLYIARWGLYEDGVNGEYGSYYANRVPAVYDADETIYVVVDKSVPQVPHAIHAISPDSEIKWVHSAYFLYDASGWASPAFDGDGTLYFKRSSSQLFAFDTSDNCLEKWSFQGHSESSAVISSFAIGPEGHIYIDGRHDPETERYLYAANSNGVLLWAYYFGVSGEDHLSGCVTGPAVAPDGTVYVGSWDKQLYAFDPNGSIKWTYEAGAGIGTTTRYVVADPSIGKDGTVYFTTTAPELYAVTPAGALVWSVPLAAQSQGTASISKDGALHVNCADGKLYVFNPDGTPRWNYNTGLSMSAPTLDANGTVYVGSDDKHLYAINPDGTLKWTFTASDKIQAQPTISEDGSLCFLDIYGWFYCIGPGGG